VKEFLYSFATRLLTVLHLHKSDIGNHLGVGGCKYRARMKMRKWQKKKKKGNIKARKVRKRFEKCKTSKIKASRVVLGVNRSAGIAGEGSNVTFSKGG
jgi:hypothetical protein